MSFAVIYWHVFVDASGHRCLQLPQAFVELQGRLLETDRKLKQVWRRFEATTHLPSWLPSC